MGVFHSHGKPRRVSKLIFQTGYRTGNHTKSSACWQGQNSEFAAVCSGNIGNGLAIEPMMEIEARRGGKSCGFWGE